jgi:predicted nucleotidyltransferase component of viral defense system
MLNTNILTTFQKEVLREIGRSNLSKDFVWGGGTALAYQYLQHRLSQDLDFFSKDLFPDKYLLTELLKISKNLKIEKIEEYKKFNRHEFWIERDKKVLKIDFVFYPFPDIKNPKRNKEFNIKIDSIEDILTNKAHTIFERNEPKDVFDFYCILQKKKIKLSLVLRWVEKKFGVEIDPVLLNSKTLQGISKLDQIKPLILKKEFYNPKKMEKYFFAQSNEYLRKVM